MTKGSKVKWTLYHSTYIRIVSNLGRLTRKTLGRGVSPKKKRIRDKKFKQVFTVALHMHLDEVG